MSEATRGAECVLMYNDHACLDPECAEGTNHGCHDPKCEMCNEAYGTTHAALFDEPPKAVEIRMQPDDLLTADIFPFTRHVWHSPEAKRNWESVLQRGAGLHHRVEYEMVRQGHRKAATLHLTNRNFEREFERFQDDGLVWLPLVRTKSYGGFSHRHFPTTPDDPDSSVYGVLACDMTAAKMFKEASEKSRTDHRTIGDLLGFPPCCTDFFEEVWAAGFYDPIWQAAERTPGVKYIGPREAEIPGSVLCAQTMRYTGHRITSHLPCSFLCEPSMEIGRIWWKVGVELDREAAGDLLRVMGLREEWSALHGIAVVETPFFTVWTNTLVTKERWTLHYTPGDWKELLPDVMDPSGS